MTPHERILCRLHLERLAQHQFAMLMLRLAVRMGVGLGEPDVRRVS